MRREGGGRFRAFLWKKRNKNKGNPNISQICGKKVCEKKVKKGKNLMKKEIFCCKKTLKECFVFFRHSFPSFSFLIVSHCEFSVLFFLSRNLKDNSIFFLVFFSIFLHSFGLCFSLFMFFRF